MRPGPEPSQGTEDPASFTLHSQAWGGGPSAFQAALPAPAPSSSLMPFSDHPPSPLPACPGQPRCQELPEL